MDWQAVIKVLRGYSKEKKWVAQDIGGYAVPSTRASIMNAIADALEAGLECADMNCSDVGNCGTTGKHEGCPVAKAEPGPDITHNVIRLDCGHLNKPVVGQFPHFSCDHSHEPCLAGCGDYKTAQVMPKSYPHKPDCQHYKRKGDTITCWLGWVLCQGNPAHYKRDGKCIYYIPTGGVDG